MRSRDFLVGLTFFGLLIILAVSTIFFADFSFVPQSTMVVRFKDGGGLGDGAEVRVDGLASGRVRGIERERTEVPEDPKDPGSGGEINVIRTSLTFDEVPILYAGFPEDPADRKRFAELREDRDWEERPGSGMEIKIAAASPLGGTVVEITSGRPRIVFVNRKTEEKEGFKNARWTPEDETQSGRVWAGAQPDLGDAIATIHDFVGRLSEEGVDHLRMKKQRDKLTLVETIRLATADLQDITASLKDDGYTLRFLLGVKSAGDLTNTLRLLREQLNAEGVEGLPEKKKEGALTPLEALRLAIDNLEKTSDHVKEISRRVKEEDEYVPKLLLGEESAENLKATLAQLNTEDLEGLRKKRKAGKLTLIESVHLAAADIQSITGKLEAKGGSALDFLLGPEAAFAVRSMLSELDDEGIAHLKAQQKLDRLTLVESLRLAAGTLTSGEGTIPMLLSDADARKEVRNAIKSLSDFIETTRENAPITTFAGIILSPF